MTRKMVRRPPEWKDWTQEQRMEFLRKQRTQYKGGRKRRLKEEEKHRVWSLLKEHRNQSLVADLLGVDRTTVYRFLKKFPMPKTFVLEESMNLTDFPEIQIWLKRLEGFGNKNTISTYKNEVRKFYEWMKKFHPERAKPSLWTSDDINEYLYGNEAIEWKGFEPYQWHGIIVPLRSLAKKAQVEFPQIDLGLLPTKRTHKAKRSLAGKEEYYFSPEQVGQMILTASTTKAKALIAFFYNTACRIEALINMRIEKLYLDKHMAEIKDKGSITWLVYGLTEKTIQLLSEYLEERGWPKKGWLFINGNGRKMTKVHVNDIIRDVGQKAKITGKVLTSKMFRKSFVKNALERKINPMSLIGTGKNPKTCMCVGWNSDIIFKHYAPQMLAQIEEDRQKFLF